MKPILQQKKTMAEKLQKAAAKLETADKLQLALNLKLSPKTVDRYTSGDETEVRRLEVAEQILAGIKSLKQPAPANA